MKNFRYPLEIAISLILYFIVLTLSLAYLKKDNIDYTFQIIVTLLPVIPCLLTVMSVIRLITQLDELQRQIQLYALAFAFTGTALATFRYGFLEHIGFPHFPIFMIWPVMATLWGVGVAIGIWRYR